MLKKKFLPIIINLFIFIFALSAYYNFSVQYYLKIDIRKIGFSNILYNVLSNQNSFVITAKLFQNSNFYQEIEVQHVKMSREQILIFFKKKKNSDLNNFLEEEIDYEEVFNFLIKNRYNEFNSIKIFTKEILNEIENPPDGIINEVRKHEAVTKELEILKINHKLFSSKIDDVLEKSPSLINIFIFSITYLLLSTVLILNNKKIRKFIS